MIPGSNLLNRAFGLIAQQRVNWFRATGSTLNSMGYSIPSYMEPVDVRGSFQPIPRRLYQTYGLEMQKNYANFYTSNDVQDIERDKTGDVLEYNGRRWQVLSESDWFPMDGWTGVLVVDIGAYAIVEPFAVNDWDVYPEDGSTDVYIDIAQYSGNSIDFVEFRFDGGDGWSAWIPVPDFTTIPFEGFLFSEPPGVYNVQIRAVLDGRRSEPSDVKLVVTVLTTYNVVHLGDQVVHLGDAVVYTGY